MADLDPQKVQAVLQDYAETLEVLTINSKPLINDLTMAAERYKPLAARIVGVIEARLFEVAAAFPLVSRVLCVCFTVCSFSLVLLYTVCVCAGSREKAMNECTQSTTERVSRSPLDS